MVTDGVLDALPFEEEEETMKELILSIKKHNPREIGRWILEKILQYNENRVTDDMTVLVAGLWDKERKTDGKKSAGVCEKASVN